MQPSQTEKHTNRHTDTLITILCHLYWEWSDYNLQQTKTVKQEERFQNYGDSWLSQA